MDAKYYKRFESFKKSFDALSDVKNRDITDSFVLSGTAAKFSITFELAWKIMKDILVQHYSIIDFVAGSPREVIKKAFLAKLIDSDCWLQMLEIRNDLAHDYDDTVIREHVEAIRDTYISVFESFIKRVDEISP